MKLLKMNLIHNGVKTDQIHAMKAFENIMLMDTKNAAFFVNDLAKLINQAADFEKKENS